MEESRFSQLYPLSIQHLDKTHWSPLSVSYKAAQFLANKPNAKILDIGSGVGKFCLAAAYYNPSAFFYGVEQRPFLVECAQSARKKLGASRVRFIQKNFIDLDFKEYDNFYFYNSFFESLSDTELNENIDSVGSYSYNNQVLSMKLNELAPGTRIATYKSLDFEIPQNYSLAAHHADLELKFWIRK